MPPLAQIPLADAFVLDLMEPWIDHTLQNVVDKLRPGGRLVVTCTCAGVACQRVLALLANKVSAAAAAAVVLTPWRVRVCVCV